MVSADTACKEIGLFPSQILPGAMSLSPSATLTDIAHLKNDTTPRPSSSATLLDFRPPKNATTMTRLSPNGIVAPNEMKMRSSPSATLLDFRRPKNATTTKPPPSARLVTGLKGSINALNEDSEDGFVLKYGPFDILVNIALLTLFFVKV